MATTDLQNERLKAAWEKFNAKVSVIRSKTKQLLSSVDEQKRNKEMEDLRKRIGQS